MSAGAAPTDGSTSTAPLGRNGIALHPRMRVEHRKCGFSLSMAGGIIPTCAGSTSSCGPTYSRRRDHPRMRGEHAAGGRFGQGIWGSSPHARGAHRRYRLAIVPSGIIPACAGSTGAGQARRPAVRNHPHMRGEHTLQSAYCGGGNGSSPHARGARALVGNRVVLPGIIPACAGSTTPCCRPTSWPRDHPRMRGEHE